MGTISAAGLYTAPATVPSPATVTATSQASPKVKGSASVKIGAFNEKLVYSFTGLTDGAAPSAALIQGSDGYYYGTAQLGGANGDGTVFKVDSSSNVTPLHEFSGKDGANPLGALIQASDGYFYGTTNLGGAKSEGTIFKMDSLGNLTTLYSFTGGDDGAQPSGGLIQASDGYLYGATLVGGASSAGVVFRTDTSGNMTTLYSFSGGTDGYGPEGSLIQATDGYFYGVTQNGGRSHLRDIADVRLRDDLPNRLNGEPYHAVLVHRRRGWGESVRGPAPGKRWLLLWDNSLWREFQLLCVRLYRLREHLQDRLEG